MHDTHSLSKLALGTPPENTLDMKLEVVVIPVSDVDRAKSFYSRLGWRLDLDFAKGEGFRVVQFTPPGSGCSVILGTNVTAAVPGSAQGLHLVVSDIVATRDELRRRGVEISELFHDAGGVFHHADSECRLSGPSPQRRSYASYASFEDPDGNSWLIQEVTVRLPGNPETWDIDFSAQLADVLRKPSSIATI